MLCDEGDNSCQSQLLRIWDHEDPHIVTGTLPSVWGGHKTEITVLLGAEKQVVSNMFLSTRTSLQKRPSHVFTFYQQTAVS